MYKKLNFNSKIIIKNIKIEIKILPLYFNPINRFLIPFYMDKLILSCVYHLIIKIMEQKITQLMDLILSNLFLCLVKKASYKKVMKSKNSNK